MAASVEAMITRVRRKPAEGCRWQWDLHLRHVHSVEQYCWQLGET
jgi:hypothetical protein